MISNEKEKEDKTKIYYVHSRVTENNLFNGWGFIMEFL